MEKLTLPQLSNLKDLIDLGQTGGFDLGNLDTVYEEQIAMQFPGVDPNSIERTDIRDAIDVVKQGGDARDHFKAVVRDKAITKEGRLDRGLPAQDPFESKSFRLIPDANQSSIDELTESVSNIQQLEIEADVIDFDNQLAGIESQNALDQSKLIQTPNGLEDSNIRGQLLESTADNLNPLVGFNDVAFEKQVAAATPAVNTEVMDIGPGIKANALREHRQNKAFQRIDAQNLLGLELRKQAEQNLIQVEKTKQKILKAAQVEMESIFSRKKQSIEENFSGR